MLFVPEGYEFVEYIENTNNSSVYKARDKNSNAIVAIKIFNNDNYTDDDLKRFKREITIISELNHQNIIKILKYDSDSVVPYYCMPLASCSLKSIIHSDYEYDKKFIFNQICEGLRYAHQNNVIHRDMKPGNILIFEKDEDCEVVISDFGLCKKLDESLTPLTVTASFIGTELYRSPEQLENPKLVTYESDIYSLGKILYEIHAKKYPHTPLKYELIDPKFRYIIQKACSYDPAERYHSIDELLLDYRDCLNGQHRDPLSLLIEMIHIEDYSSNENVEKILKLFYENSTDENLFFKGFDKIPEKIINSMIEIHLELFKKILFDYLKILDRDLGFDYCDTVAKSLNFIYRNTHDIKIKVEILFSLIKISYRNNRYYPRAVFIDLISDFSEEDPSMYYYLRDFFDQNNEYKNWIKSDERTNSLPGPIQRIIS